MDEVSSDNFFFSESLKDILDQQVLLENAINEMIKQEGAVEIVGNFISMSMKDNTMILEISPKVAKFLLTNNNETYAFSFMDEMWILKASNLSLEKFDGEKFKATLDIEARK